MTNFHKNGRSKWNKFMAARSPDLKLIDLYSWVSITKDLLATLRGVWNKQVNIHNHRSTGKSSCLPAYSNNGRIFHENYELHTFTDISKSPTRENSAHIIKKWRCPHYFSIELEHFFNDKFSQEWPVDVKQIYGLKITWLETARFVFMNRVKMCTQSTAFKDAVQLQRRKWKGSMLF
jgi:hypothetical protein